MHNFKIKKISPKIAKTVCQSITLSLPEWFGIPEANERYSQGMKDKISFAAYIDDECVAMISLEFPYLNNANIYWMGVSKSYHKKNIGKQLLITAEKYCIEQGCSSLTVETLSPKQGDKNYLKTYEFYKKMGFQSLFELNTYGPENLMVYMYKNLRITKHAHAKTKAKDIKLVPATKDKYPVLFNLARFYAYDISEFFGDEPGWEMEEDGLYGVGVNYKKYFEDKTAFPFFIRYRGELAGFVIVDKETIDPTADFNMAQFFILRTYKRKGVGRYSAFNCFDEFKGTWEVMVMPGNETAYHFWRSIISEYTDKNCTEGVIRNKNGEERITFKFKTASL